MRSATVALLVGLSVVALGCGTEAEVEDAVDETIDAFAERDGQEACDEMLPQAQAITAGFAPIPIRCPQVIESLAPQDVAGCRELEVRDLRVLSDDSARVRVAGPEGDARVDLVRIDGVWKLKTPPCGPGILR